MSAISSQKRARTSATFIEELEEREISDLGLRILGYARTRGLVATPLLGIG
jgi:hypothetical protein